MKPKVKKPTEKELQEAKTWPTWEKDESKFPWEYDAQGTCFILEGKALIHKPEGNVEFGEGDYVVFPKSL